MSKISIFYQPRTYIGTKIARNLRKNHQIPAIIYGKDIKPTLNIIINEKNLINLNLTPLVYNFYLINIINNFELKTIIKAIQYHPYKQKIFHIDFFVKSIN